MVCSFDRLSTVCNAVPGEPSDEVCDGLDNDCDTVVDEGVTTTFYIDGDGDGYGYPLCPRKPARFPRNM